MLEVKLIHCPIDFSEFSVRAYRHAQSLAEHYRAKVVVQHIVEVWRHPSASFAASTALYDEYCQTLRGNGKQQLQEFVKNHTHDEVMPEFVVDEGMAPDSILSFAEAQKSDLIVMGTHGLRGFDRLMLGSVTDRVMRRAPCPVMGVREPPPDLMAAGHEQRYTHHLNRILSCTDFSENSVLALNYGISATEEYNAELTVLHVLEEVPSAGKTEEAIAAATEQLESLIPRESRKTLKVKTAVRIGKPYREIIQFAEETKTDLVTLGVRGRGALELAVFGSTTYRVLQLGPCPVLVVHI
ncbi:MAG: universal stress protein [Candidatus Acidiferrales bacterium]